MAGATMSMVFNPHIGGEVWATDWVNRRKIYGDEYAFWNGLLGGTPLTISAQWFDSIPLA